MTRQYNRQAPTILGLPTKHPDYSKSWHLWNRYKITPADRERMIADQNGVCAICKKVPYKWHIDHDHTTNEIRGLLCPTCNKGLGMFKDNIAVMQAAVEYLKRYT